MTARAVALTVGVSYALLTGFELLIGRWTVGDGDILLRTTKANLFHWAAALALLGSFFAGPGASRLVTRVAGLILLGISAWGFLAPASFGEVLGFPGEIPAAYNAFHALTGVGALVGGFRAVRRPA